jgi:hypothetical protein
MAASKPEIDQTADTPSIWKQTTLQSRSSFDRPKQLRISVMALGTCSLMK